MRRNTGFTLLEILIALFIFSILSLIIVNALHTVLSAQSNTEKHATRLAQLQIALTLLSRDFEQAIERPIINVSGAQELSFLGTRQTVTFTHTGLFNPLEKLPRSTLQRTRYQFEKGTLTRTTWTALDQTKETKPLKRQMLQDVAQLDFEYLDNDGKFQNRWPPATQNNVPLPRAVRVSIMLNDLGKMSQLYVIPVQKITKPS